MIRCITFGSVLCFLLAASPAQLFGQWGGDPRMRRAHRERAVAIVGPGARDFVETHGDQAVAAIFACSKPVAVKLAEFHACGELDRLIRPRDLLWVIAQPGNGNDVALWAIYHSNELFDRDAFDAYLLSPMEYAMGLKDIATGAAEARARRLNQAVASRPLTHDEKVGLAGLAGCLAIVGFLYWRRRRQSAMC